MILRGEMIHKRCGTHAILFAQHAVSTFAFGIALHEWVAIEEEVASFASGRHFTFSPLMRLAFIASWKPNPQGEAVTHARPAQSHTPAPRPVATAGRATTSHWPARSRLIEGCLVRVQSPHATSTTSASVARVLFTSPPIIARLFSVSVPSHTTQHMYLEGAQQTGCHGRPHGNSECQQRAAQGS